MTDSDSCTVCAFVQSTPPGGWYLVEPLWRVGPHMTSQVPGWSVAYLRRHGVGARIREALSARRATRA